MKRREFITLVGGAAAAWPLATHAQQPAIPVIGYLTGGTLNKSYIAAVLQGLKDADYVEGRNIVVEYRSAEGRYDQLPALAADLAGRQVVAILAEGGSAAARAAKQATSTIPIVFVNGDDPIKSGLVSSLNRPKANLTDLTSDSHLDYRLGAFMSESLASSQVNTAALNLWLTCYASFPASVARFS
jgi:putative ABC transport system substrate-binding protein